MESFKLHREPGEIGTFVAIILAALLLYSCQSITKSSSSDSLPEDMGFAWAACQNKTAAQLKAPATAEFPTMLDIKHTKRPYGYDFNGWVDSQNSFGALIRTNFLCIAKGSGENFTAEIEFLN